MKKNYLMLACMLLFMAVQVKAQVSSITDLYGKYKFKATVEYTTEGEAYKDVLKAECDALIEEASGFGIAQIVGFAGAEEVQYISAISTEKEMVKVTNPNSPKLWDNLYLANVDGDNPYGYFNDVEMVWEVEGYGPLYYTYDPDTKDISIPDFTVVTLGSVMQDKKGTVMARYTNVKLVFVEAIVDETPVSDVSGEWNFKAGSSTYSTMQGSVVPTEFTVNLEKTDENNRAYNATISIEGYNEVQMPATFDGHMLSLAYNNLYLDEANGIRFAPMYGWVTSGTIEFQPTSESSFYLYGGFSLASDSIGKTAAGVDTTFINEKMHQWYMDGTLKAATAAPDFTWDGVYNLEVASPSDVIIAGADVDASAWPTAFQMEVVYSEEAQSYFVTKLFGYDLVSLNEGGLSLVPNAEGGASIMLNEGSYQVALLNNNGDGTFLQLTNESGTKDAPISLTLNEDGTVSMTAFFIQNLDFNSGASSPIVYYQNITATKEEAAPAFDLVGEYVLKAGTVDVYDNSVAFPEEFDVKIEYFDGTQYGMDSYYFISSFMGKNLASSVIEVTEVEAGKTYEVEAGVLCGSVVPGELYYKLYDMNATDTPITLTVNEDGTLSMDNFYIKLMNYTENTEKPGAFYKEVKLGGEEVAPAFDLVGEYVLKAGTVDVYDNSVTFPEEFDVKIEYFDGTQYGMDSYYFISSFMGKNLASSVIEVTEVEAGKTYEVEAGVLCGSVVPGELYYKLYDMNATDSPITLTVNEDGTLSMDNFYIKLKNYTDNTEKPGAFYKEVTLGEEVAPAFDLVGEYVLKAGTVDAYDNSVAFPEEFDVKIEYFDGTQYGMDSYYFISSFMGKNLASSVIEVTEVEAGKTYEVEAGVLCGSIVPGELYYKLYDMNATDYPITLTVNEDGTLSMDNFYIKLMNYTDNTEKPGAFYKEVTLTTGTTGIKEIVERKVVKGIFDMSGRQWKEIPAPGLYIIDGKKVLVK